MNVLVPLMLFGWFPITLALYAVLRPASALSVSFLVGWLILPYMSYPVQGIPDFDKFFVVSVSNLLAASLFHWSKFPDLRWSFCDIPVAVFCLVPMASSIDNELGAYDGFSAIVRQLVVWGIPYFLGRLFLHSWVAVKEFAIGIAWSGLFYVPFCLYEIRMSPQISNMVYGVSQFSGGRLGGWRPSVFLKGGLELGMWMTSATLMLFCVWSGDVTKKIWLLPTSIALAVVSITTVFCKSTGALTLLIAGITAFLVSRKYATTLPVILLSLSIPLYVGVRSTNMWDGRAEAAFIAEHFDEDRAQSFDFRLRNEDILAEKAWQQPLFGWGGWGGNRVYNEDGRDISITDGLWIIEFGCHGIVGLAGLVGLFMLPGLLCAQKLKSLDLHSPERSVWLGLGIMVTLFGIDCLFNAMPNPIYMLALGAVVSTATVPIKQASISLAREMNNRQRRKLANPFLRHTEELPSYSTLTN